MKHALSLGVILFVLWLLLSGHFTPLMISFGVISVLLTLMLSVRMKVIDRESHPLHLTGRLFKFWPRLGWMIVKSNLDVAARILGFKPVEPQFIKLPFRQKDDLSRTIYANAITLTPGSASIHIEGDELYVHTISREGAESLFNGDMQRIAPEVDESKACEGEI